NFWWFALCVLIIPIPWAVWQILKTANTKFNLSSQRLQLEQGVFSKSLEEIELYRIKDTELTRSFVQRILGLGTVVVLSSDTTMPRMEIPSIKGPQDLRDQIRDNVELVRKRRGVRELDVN
ncbi:MAG: PH domain-containing protein, partial [Planctomycetota bacterium]